jgi:hypothetical protein
MTTDVGEAVEAAPTKGGAEAARSWWLGNPRFRVPYTNTIIVGVASAFFPR